MKASPYQVQAFTHAARERSFSKAAIVMGVTQSSITQHVAKLEKIMGTMLFIRRREGLELTPAGRELFEISDPLRNLEQLIEEKIEDLDSLSAGHLRIVANAPRPAFPILSRYSGLYPLVRIDFSLVSWDVAMQQLGAREVDIAIVAAPPADEGVWAAKLEETHYRAFLRRENPLARRNSLSLKEISESTIVVPEDGSLTQRVVNEKALALGIRFDRLLKTTTFSMVKEAVLHDVGIGIMLDDGQFPSSQLTSIPIDEMPERYDNVLVTPNDKRNLRLVNSFCDVALDMHS